MVDDEGFWPEEVSVGGVTYQLGRALVRVCNAPSN
jgi:hypothetical protein